jgi:hypothetical protein
LPERAIQLKAMNQFKTSGLILPLALVLGQLIASSCSGQPREEKERASSSQSKPDIRYRVDKKYDDKGNVVKYDSSYTYSYRSGDIASGDSIISRMLEQFRSPWLTDPAFSGMGDGSIFSDGFRESNRMPFPSVWHEHRALMDSLMQDFVKRNKMRLVPDPTEKAGGRSGQSHHL